MRYLLLAVPALIFAGCAQEPTPPIIVEKPVVYMPDEKLFVCPDDPDYPDPDNGVVTDQMIAGLILEQDMIIGTCRRSLNTVKSTLEQAKRNIERQ